MKTMRNLLLAIMILAAAGLQGQDYKVNTEKSTLKWTGEKLAGKHWGYIKIKSGDLTVKNDQIKGGTFIIDMNSITNSDVESDEYKEKLVGHLKSDDFFGTANYPEAKLVIAKATKFKDNKAEISALLTIKGKMQPIVFNVVKNGEAYSAKIVVDRSKYDVKYGSKSFFDNLGDKVISDEFTMDVDLVVAAK